jgi:hypothetical protein
VSPKDRIPIVGALGLAAIALAGGIIGTLSWTVAATVLAVSLGVAGWLWQRGKERTPAAPEGPVIEGGLRIAEKPLDPGKRRFRHGLRVTISTEVAVSLGLRVVCDVPILEVEALAQLGRGAGARQGTPPPVRESREAWLFAVRNSPGQRELFVRVDLFAAQPIHLQRVDQVRPGGAVALPEWKELDPGLAEEVEEAAAPAAPGNPSPPSPSPPPAK